MNRIKRKLAPASVRAQGTRAPAGLVRRVAQVTDVFTNGWNAFARSLVAEGKLKGTVVRKFLPARFVVDRGHQPVIIAAISFTPLIHTSQ